VTFSERVPPQDLEAEKSVLGALMIDSRHIAPIRALVAVDDWYSSKHRMVYEAICSLNDRQEPIDLVTVRNELTKRNNPDIGTISYLAALTEALPSTVNAEAYARIVVDKASIRRVQDAARRIADECYTANSAAEAKTLAYSEMEKAVFAKESTLLKPVGQVLFEYVAQAHDNFANGRPSTAIVPTPFARQDLVMPMEKGTVTVVPSPSQMGKTTWMFNLMMGAAKMNEPGLIFSLEMSQVQVAQKLWASEMGINTLSIRHQTLTEKQWIDSLNRAAESLKLPLRAALKPALKVAQIRLETLAYKARHGKVSFVAVDYWQIIGDRPMRDEPRHEMLGRLIQEDMKSLAIEADCHVILLAQTLINSTKPIPTNEDVKDSRAIVAAADNVLFLTRPVEFGSAKIFLPTQDGTRTVEIACNAIDPTDYTLRDGDRHIIRKGLPLFADVMLGIQGKQRMGPKSLIPYHIDLATGRMRDLFNPWPWDNERKAGYSFAREDYA
jgi:replicative DNA helicase